MASLADLPELVGFFSYSREDDTDSDGALSALRTRIQAGLRGQLGRTAKTFRLWQDKEAIPSGTLWESEIKNAVAQSVFFIPIITPTVIASPYCHFELESFLAREAELGRDDLVFPILYIDVPALEDATRRQNDPVLSLIAKRQYVDWREIQYLDIDSTEVKRQVGRFCTHIRDALHRPWFSPEERKQQDEAAALARAEAERQRQAAEVKRRTEEKARAETAAEAQTRERAEQARRGREAEAEQRRVVETKDARRSDEHHVPELQSKCSRSIGAVLVCAGGIECVLTSIFFVQGIINKIPFEAAIFAILGLLILDIATIAIGIGTIRRRRWSRLPGLAISVLGSGNGLLWFWLLTGSGSNLNAQAILFLARPYAISSVVYVAGILYFLGRLRQHKTGI